MTNSLLRWRRVAILAFQSALIAIALSLAFLLRFDFSIPAREFMTLRKALCLVIVAKILVIRAVHFDRGWLRYVSIADLFQIFRTNLVGSLLFAAGSSLLIGPAMGRSIYALDFLLCFVITSGARFSVRIYSEAISADFSAQLSTRRILIYGAGPHGINLVRELRANPDLGYRVLGFLDDDPTRHRRTLMGVPVLGSGPDAARLVADFHHRGMRVDQIVIAMPSASGREMRQAIANCRVAGVPCKTVPGVDEMLRGQVLTRQLRDVSVVDLLGREPVKLDETLIRSSIQRRSILVTGAAGSIGSEICRQLARFRPGRLVAFEQAESDLFRIQNELERNFPEVDIVPCIGDIRDYSRVDEVIREHAIESIFHAAAYKHVPMMEAHILEAARNNILGTRNVALAAERNGVATFLMISSDKAVNPTSVMGVTKRIAELFIGSLPLPSEGGRTKFTSVRFGNVLGSNGSVIPLFMQQIAAGGPITVTHPEMRRYFMTIPEAVQLVLQASTMGKGSEIFVLDMGEPVRIVDLARNMIQLAGKEPDTDIEIRFTGLRPGEKLFEELITDEEHTITTYHEKIRIFQGARLKRGAVEQWIRELEDLTRERDATAVIEHMRFLVPEYRPSQIPRPALVAAAAFGARLAG